MRSLLWIFLAFVVLVLQHYLEARCKIKASLHYTKNRKGFQYKVMIKQWWENQQRNREAKWHLRQWQTWDCSLTLLTPTTYLLYHFASWCKLFVKIEFRKQRNNLIMRLELCRFNMAVKEVSPFPALFTHESMDCQVWVYRIDICYLYTCFYIWSASDFPLDTVFERLWGKHQGFFRMAWFSQDLFIFIFVLHELKILSDTFWLHGEHVSESEDS